MADQFDTLALFENELDRVRRYLPHNSFANLRAAAEMREQAHKDRVDELLRLLTQERFERLQLADAYKRDLALLAKPTREEMMTLIAQLRVALWECWQTYHDEHCSHDWPHRGVCHYPPPPEVWWFSGLVPRNAGDNELK